MALAQRACSIRRPAAIRPMGTVCSYACHYCVYPLCAVIWANKDACFRRGSRKKHLGGPGPPKFSLPSLFPYPFPFSPLPPKLSLPSLSPFPSLPFPPPSPFLFPHPFLSLPFPLSFPSRPFPSLRSRPP